MGTCPINECGRNAFPSIGDSAGPLYIVSPTSRPGRAIPGVFSMTVKRAVPTRARHQRIIARDRPPTQLVGQRKELRMATIHMHQHTTSTPEQFIAGVTDFGPGRQALFGNSADDYMKVHSQGPTEADVTEGSSGIWERLHYDWSDPARIVMTTTDSNLWGGNSGHTYTLTRLPDGTTDVDAIVVREGKNLKGRLLGFVLDLFGESVLGKEFEKSVKAIEARSHESERAPLGTAPAA
jgi:hypothetical protein